MTYDDAWVIGENIAFRLECAGMTVRDLCERTGMSYATATNYTRGLNVPSAVRLKRIAKAIGTTTDLLLEGVAE